MDEVTESVQPDEGQGGDGGGSAPWAEYLERIPEEVRGDVEPVFRDWDANFTRRSQEAAEYRKSWEPYEQVGVNQYDPETVQWALQFRQAAEQNPQSIQEWYTEYAQQHGLTQAQAEELAAEVDPDVQALVDKQLQQQLGPLASSLAELSEWRESQETARAEQAASAQIEHQLEELKVTPQEKAMVEKFVPQYIQSDPEHAVQLAVQDWRNLQKQIEQDFVKAKSEQPAAAESGGTANSAPDAPQGWKDINAQVLARLAAEREA